MERSEHHILGGLGVMAVQGFSRFRVNSFAKRSIRDTEKLNGSWRSSSPRRPRRHSFLLWTAGALVFHREEAAMAEMKEAIMTETGLRRKLLLLSLGLRPGDLRRHLSLDGVRVSFVIGGTRRLRGDEGRRLKQVVAKRLEDLFE
jgi:hypothetical protein